MSDPSTPAPAARQRPGTVTISSYLLYLTAALFAVTAIVGLSTIGTLSDVYTDAYAGTSIEGAEGFVVGIGVVSAVVQLLIAVGLVVLALLNNQGRNGARITTWVVAGLGLCCTGLGLGGTATSGMGGGGSGDDLPDPQVVQERLDAALPSWSAPLTLTFGILSFLALLAAIILLALPASNQYFRKQPAGWEPPVPGAGYPAQPPYPGQAPQSGAEPGYPPYPGQQAPPPGTDPGYPPNNPPGGQSGPPNNPPAS